MLTVQAILLQSKGTCCAHLEFKKCVCGLPAGSR